MKKEEKGIETNCENKRKYYKIRGFYINIFQKFSQREM